ncbi:uncharacterized protein [Zea mays]|uniref:uncharacterized protein isoform X2 n=1 Tax=Zea mays TaxID=4577 RepID=UPI0009A96FE7|nr:uncharacterized protein LOC103638359 isoform X2 [Zea mays]|eukprot:XP_020400032.1 uncharacterized protein LOC103638359 isoform X2 [Zea mays]
MMRIGKMASARGNNKGGSYNEYEQQKLENIERNKRRLEEFNIPAIINSLGQQQNRSRKTSKKVQNRNTVSTERPNLRPRLQRNNCQFDEEHVLANLEPVGDFLSNNEDLQIGDQSNGTVRKKGRGITKKDDIFSRTPDMPKLKISLNDYGQPIGENARQLSSVIGCQVRKKISIACVDWRLVDVKKKYELWTEIKSYFDIDDAALNWVTRTAGRKWKEFKANIKELYFDPELTIDDVGECPDKRISDDDWKFLYNYWKTSEFQTLSKVGKANRQKLQLHHTTGSVSYACSQHKLAVKLGRPPRRDETFIKTHTRKNGVPSTSAEPIMAKLKDLIEIYPDLKERTIQEGDAYAVLCGLKEPKGYVRLMGLGPTPQDVGTPGLKCYAPTRLQMEVMARKKAESDRDALEQRVFELQAQMEQRAQQDRASPMSQHGSTSRLHLDARLNETGDAGLDEGEEDYVSEDDVDDNLHDQVHGLTSSRTTAHKTTAPRSNETSRSQHDALVGKDVILYALLRSDQPVAKGTIISTKPNTILAGQSLGRQCCEVIVSCVLKRDAHLPRPYANMETMGDANKMSIAWPYNRITNKASTPPAV